MTIGPISLFDNVKQNQASDCEQLSFDEFVEIMSAYSKDFFAGKADAPLICTTEFKNGKRLKANATLSSVVVLDIDDHLTIEAVSDSLVATGIRSLLCSTASNRQNHHKFRVFVPLAKPAAYEQHGLAWHVLNHAVADGKADPSKIGCESLFYVPGQYAGAPSVFEVFDGDVYDADQLIALVGDTDDVYALAGKKPVSRKHHANIPTYSPTRPLSPIGDADLDLSRTRLVTDRAYDAYLNPSGPYHHARFGLLMSMARRAQRLGVTVSAADLRDLFNQVDGETGSHYRTQDHQRALLAEAQKALGSV